MQKIYSYRLWVTKARKMQFEVDGEGWERLWTEETRLAVVGVLFFIVLFNLLVPLGEDRCKEKDT